MKGISKKLKDILGKSGFIACLLEKFGEEYRMPKQDGSFDEKSIMGMPGMDTALKVKNF